MLTLVFKKNAKFFTENYQKSHKIVNIISTPAASWKLEQFLNWGFG
jgi:hypothetical protein